MPISGAEWREINELLSECLDASRTPDAGSAQRFASAVASADRAGRAWPDELREHILLEWANRQQKGIVKREAIVLVDYNGRKHVKSTRVGRYITEGDGSGHFQQTLLDKMTWAEVYRWGDLMKQQVEGGKANIAMVARLRHLHELVPDSDGPAEAASTMGCSVAQWLSDAS